MSSNYSYDRKLELAKETTCLISWVRQHLPMWRRSTGSGVLWDSDEPWWIALWRKLSVTLRRSRGQGAGPALHPVPLLPLCVQLVFSTLYFHHLLYLCLNGSSHLSYFGMSSQSLKCLTQYTDTKGKRGKYFMNYSLTFRGFHGLRAREWPHTSKPEWQRFLSWWLMLKKASFPSIDTKYLLLPGTYTRPNIIFI